MGGSQAINPKAMDDLVLLMTMFWWGSQRETTIAKSGDRAARPRAKSRKLEPQPIAQKGGRRYARMMVDGLVLHLVGGFKDFCYFPLVTLSITPNGWLVD